MKLGHQGYQKSKRNLVYMESGPSRVSAPLEGPVIPRSRRSLSRTKVSQEFTMHTPDKQVPCGGALHAKERWGGRVERTGGGAV